MVCGPNVLTANDLNLVPTPHFDSLALIPFNLNVGYPDDAEIDNWLIDYRAFHNNPVIMLEDNAYARSDGKKTTLIRGRAWCWRPGEEKVRLTAGEPVSPH